MSSSPVRTAVIPAAGLGTRFLPATKSVPKEMLTIVDRPVIQWVIEEAVGAGIDDILIITSPTKKTLEDHFDRSAELEASLQEKGKLEPLAQIKAITDMASFHFTRQGAPLGLGHAVSMARHHVGDRPFAVLLPDEFIPDGGATLRSMIDAYGNYGSNVALRQVPMEEVSSYGCPRVSAREDGTLSISEIVEKPDVADAPSDFAVVGRYVFGPEIFDRLEKTEPGKGGEIQLTDAMAMLTEDPGLSGVVFDTTSFDAGQKLSWLQANIELAIADAEMGADARAMLADVLSRNGS